MKTARKVLLIALCAILLVSASVMGTMAYLTSQASVTNTFTVGKVNITLDEADVKTDGTYVTDVNARVDANEYHLLPGHSYIKDPTIHVDADSEDCWLFVKVENGISAIEDSANTIAAQMTGKGWIVIDSANNIYGREATNKAGDNVAVFGTFKISGTADVARYADAQIVVTAYAVQADGFDTAADAWTAANFQ